MVEWNGNVHSHIIVTREYNDLPVNVLNHRKNAHDRHI